MSGHIYTKISQPADHSLVILKMIPMEVFRLGSEINHDCEPQVADSRCTTYKNQLRGKEREREQASEVGERLVLNRRGTMFHRQAAMSEENCLMPCFQMKVIKKKSQQLESKPLLFWETHFSSQANSTKSRTWSMIPDIRQRQQQVSTQTSKHPSLLKSMKVQPRECQEKLQRAIYIFQAWQTMQERFVPRAIRKTEYGSNVPPVDKEHALPLYFL